MVTVEADVDQVERRLGAGELSCPACGGVLAGWGRARPRQLRGPDGLVELCPRRSRCTGCGVTHVLLPVTALLRRADTAAVIVSALAAKATRRAGFRRIAADLARPAETVRGWLRRFARRADLVRAWLLGLLDALVDDPRLPAGQQGPLAGALSVLGELHAQMPSRWPLVASLSPWQLAARLSRGGLLSPAWPPGAINASSPVT
jgi:hypothetical protein